MLNLTKGQTLNLTKDTGVTNVEVQLGWKLTAEAAARAQLKAKNDPAIDLDAMAFMCLDNNGRPKCPSEKFFVFFQPEFRTSVDGAISLSGDDRDGGDGINPDEVITIDLAKVSALAPEITEIAVYVNVYEGLARGHNFGMLESAFLRIVETRTGKQICEYQLKDTVSDATSMQVGSFEKKDNQWVFEAVGKGYTKTLAQIVQAYGLE